MFLNRISFINGLPLRIKISLAVALIFALVVTLLTTYHVQRERAQMMEQFQVVAEDLSTMYFDTLNTMMLTGTMEQRDIVPKKMLNRPNVIEARSIRGAPVIQQYGAGNSNETAQDELDRRALNGEVINQVVERNGRLVLTVITPFLATDNTRGVNCLQCHNVPPGTVNGAVRISFSLDELEQALNHEMWVSIGGNLFFFALGLLMVNVLMKSWVITPLGKIMGAVTQRAAGDLKARAAGITTEDELGRLANAFNNMADITDEAATREQAAGLELRSKVDGLLTVVNRVAQGDFAAKVNFSGHDAIGELGQHLQKMIDVIRDSTEEKRVALERLQRRVDRILTVVRKASEGDLTGKADDEGDDAIGQLSRGVQRMMDSLNALVTQVQRSGIQVASSATAIAATAKEQEATVAEQAATTNEIVTTATEISATSKELLSTMDQVSKVADGTGKSAEAGRAGLQRMESTMQQIVEASSSISSKFEVLNEKAGNISTVVTTITKVADQTNLLSLNAAIEAEKAGEYGFGFSVVAKEIRRLADQTAVATLDIEQMVKEMQAAVSAGVMSMEKFSQQVRHSVNDVREIGSQLAMIIEQVQALTPRFESVHQGMHFQSEGAQHINQSMIQLNEAAQQTVESLRESNDAIIRLNEAARDLQNGVTKFKVRYDG